MTRDEAIQELVEWITQMIEHGVPNYSTRYKALKLAIEALQAEPVKHGEWEVIKRGQTGYSASDFKCSVCGTPNRCYTLTNHCAHCGAKMDKEKNGNIE